MGRLPVSVFESAQSEKKTCIFTIKKMVQMAAKSCSAGWQIIWRDKYFQESPSHGEPCCGKPFPWQALPVEGPSREKPRGEPSPW